MKCNINECIEIYQQLLNQGNLQIAYKALIDLVNEIKNNFDKQYQTNNISLGYLDFTYFPFFNDYLRINKLRFGVVLNHQKMRFELWLMGQNKAIQEKYWNLLKDTKWNEGINVMPKYAVLELVLYDQIDFNQKQVMITTVINQAILYAKEIQEYLETRK